MTSQKKVKKQHIQEKKTNISFADKVNRFLSISEKQENPKLLLGILILILLSGFIIRFLYLGELWLNEDETYTMTAAKRMITGTGSQYQTSILYTLIQYILFLILGINEFAARIPGVVFGVLSIAATFYFSKRYINTKTAIFTAILMSFSFFEVYFSRTARPYTALQLSYISLSWIFLLSFTNNTAKQDTLVKSLLKFISLKYFSLFIVLFLISILIHPWTVLFWVTTIFYFFVMFFYTLLNKDTGNQKYSYLSLGFLFIMVVAVGWLIIESGLFAGLFQQRATIDVVVPDLARTYNFLKDDPFKGVLHYFKLFSYDFNYLWIIACIGFATSFYMIKDKRFLFFLHSMVISNLIMLSFFIHVLQQRYFFPVYPFYLIYVAIGLFSIYSVASKLLNAVKNELISWGIVVFIVIMIFCLIPYESYFNMYNLKMRHNIYIDSQIGEYTFYPYRKACKYVQENIKPGEEILSTMPRIAEVYIDRDIMALRQAKVNLNKFNVADEIVADTTIYPNQTVNHRSFMEYLKTHKSGWLIADARINTVLSLETREFILNHFDFHFLGSNPASVMLVGRWDSAILAQPKKVFWVLHEQGNTAQFPYIVKIDPNQDIMLSVIYSGVEKDNEAICSVGGLSSYLPSNRSLGIPDTADWVMNAAELSKSQYVNFSYNIDCQDSLKGFMLHNLTVLLSKKRQ